MLEERPREKLMERGAAALDVTELLAILIRNGTRLYSAVDLARRVYEQADYDLRQLANLSYEALAQLPGMGQVKAVTLLAALELARRLGGAEPQSSVSLTCSQVVVQMMQPLLRDLMHEECWVVYLNRANRVLSKERVSMGGLSATVVDSRIIVRRALEKSATGLILVHNHPSGEPLPGKQDIEQTRLLRDALSYFDIHLLDHIIIAGNRYYSFCDEGT